MTEGNYGTYQPEYGKRGSSASIKAGTITFTSFDPVRRTFSATFAFTAKDDRGHLYEIKQGVVKDGVIGNDAILH